MKKVFSFVLALCLIIPCLFFLTACGEDKSDRTMKMSLNPDVSFVVDGKDNIVSVSFDNQDAGTIYADVNFVGKNVDEAVKIFVEYSAISGHLNFSGDEVTLEVNGSVEADITDLEQKVKKQVEQTFDSLGVNVNVKIQELSEVAKRDALENAVKNLAPELSSEEIDQMTEEQLVEIIKNKQKEFEGLAYNQIEAIKNSYNSLNNLLLQSIEILRNTVDSLQTQLLTIEQQLSGVQGAFADSLRAQISQLQTQIDAKQAEIEAKVNEYLQAKQAEIQEAKAYFETNKQNLVNAFKQEVENNKTAFNAHLENAKANGEITQEQYDYFKQLQSQND